MPVNIKRFLNWRWIAAVAVLFTIVTFLSGGPELETWHMARLQNMLTSVSLVVIALIPPL